MWSSLCLSYCCRNFRRINRFFYLHPSSFHILPRIYFNYGRNREFWSWATKFFTRYWSNNRFFIQSYIFRLIFFNCYVMIFAPVWIFKYFHWISFPQAYVWPVFVLLIIFYDQN